MDANRFGAFIAGLRREKHMTQAHLAELLQVTDKAVSRWERGIGFPDVGTLFPLSKALGVSISELMHAEKTTTVLEEKENTMDMEKYSIKSVRMIDDITGYGHTHQWDVWGTDLGIPVYSPTYQRMYFLFGDTFSPPEGVKPKITSNKDKYKMCNRRGTVAGYTTDFDLSNGLRWEGFLSDKKGNARALIDAHYTGNTGCESTKISQGGIEIDGALYVFYESIRNWDSASTGFNRSWRINYSGVIKSLDGGETFERVYDLTWVETDQGENVEVIKRLAEEDMELRPSGFDLDLSTHVAPGFGQMYPVDGKDGYVYIYGRHGGRAHGIKVGRVKRNKFESFSEYEYLTGFENGDPVWVKGQEGLNILHNREPECDIIAGPCSNMTVHYNAYLSKWVLIYYKVGIGIMFAVSDTPYGAYSTPKVLLPIDDPMLTEDNPKGGNVLYGGFTHELLNKEGGKRMMMIISQFYTGFYNSKLVEVTFE